MKKISPEIFKDFEQILLFVQKTNDMDTCCNALALLRTIRHRFPEKQYGVCGLCMESKLLPEINQYRIKDKETIDFQKKTIGILSEVTIPRVTRDLAEMEKCESLILIDHHLARPEDKPFQEPIVSKLTTLNEPDYNSVCEYTGDLMKEDWEIDQESARILFMGMYSESQGFKSITVNANTFRIAKEIMELNPKANETIKEVNKRSPLNAKIFVETIRESKIDGNLIYMEVLPTVVQYYRPDLLQRGRDGKIRQKNIFTFILSWAQEFVSANTYIMVHYSLFEPFDSSKRMVYIAINSHNPNLEELLTSLKFRRNKHRWCREMKYYDILKILKEYRFLFTK